MAIGALVLVVAACGGERETRETTSPAVPGGTIGCAATNGVAHRDREASVGMALGAIDGEASAGTRTGNAAPNFRLETTCGETVTLEALRGRPVLVNFWATWCGPCRAEMPELQRLHERMGDKLVVLAVDVDESPGQVTAFAQELGITFTTVLDRGSKVFNRYRLLGLPSTYVIDAEGVTRAIKVGPFASAEDVDNAIREAGL